MAVICGVCHEAHSKYKCPTCELRYCSIACYKPHKAAHEATHAATPASEQPVQPRKDRPGTKNRNRAPALDFSTLQSDPAFKHLMIRYPLLHTQLGAIYGLTLDPGPEEARGWNRGPLPSLDPPPRAKFNQRGRGRGRGRGDRGGFRGGRGGFGGDTRDEERQHGNWTKEKGDKEALVVLKRMREGKQEDERAEGLREFVRLVAMRYGEESRRKQDEEMMDVGG